MKIDIIQADNLKGRSFEHKLRPLTMITGPNDTGKTAITDAVRLVLLGHLPERGKTNPATMAIASASKMRVSGWFDNGTTQLVVTRTWTKKGKSVTATAENAESLPETPLVLLDADAFFSCKSDKARTDMLFSVLRLDPKEFNRDTVRAALREAVREEGELSDFDKLTADPEKPATMDEWLNGLAASTAEEKAKAGAEARRFEQTAQGIIQLRLGKDPVDPARIAADIEAARANVARMQNELGELRREEKLAGETSSRRANLLQQMATNAAAIGTGATGDIEALSAEVSAAQVRIGELIAAYNQSREAYESAQRARARIDVLRAKVATIEAKPKPATGRVAQLQQHLEQLGAAPDVSKAATNAETMRAKLRDLWRQTQENDAARSRITAEYEDAIKKPCCPVCGNQGDTFKAFLGERYERRIAELAGEKAKIEGEHRAASEQLQAAEKAHNDALQLEKGIQRINRELGDARVAEQEFLRDREAQEAARVELASLGNPDAPAPGEPVALIEARQSAANLQREITRAAAARDNAKLAAELASLPATAEQIGEDVYRLECDLNAANERIGDLQKAEQEAQNQKADDQRLAQAQEEREKALTRERLLKVLGDALAIQREEMINKVFRPLLDVVNRFTQGILPTALEFHDGELGRYSGGNWVAVNCFGGCFTAVTYAGIQAALGASAPAKLIIVDEMGRLDRDFKVKFLENVKAAVKDGTIEQFIGIDPDPAPYGDIAGLTLLNVR